MSFSYSLIDHGANGGVGGEDVRVLHQHAEHHTMDIEGIDEHRFLKIPLCTVGGVAQTVRVLYRWVQQNAYSP